MTAGNPWPQSAETALRCAACGRKAVSAFRCSACGAEAAAPSASLVVNAPGAFQAIHLSGSTLVMPGGQREIVVTPRPVSHPAHDQFGGEVSGRVLIVSAPVNEPADPDYWKWLAVPAWGLVLLISPVAAGILVWMNVGLLAAAVAVIGCIAVLRFIFSNHLLTSWQFVAALRGQHIVEAVPNIAIRLRTDRDHEVQLRVKGRLSGGGLVEGDRIRAIGRWRAGVFHVTQFHCARTGAAIAPVQPNSLATAISGAAILIVTFLWLHLAGVPWLLARLEHARQLPKRLQTKFLTR